MDHLMTTCDSTSVHIETKRLLIVDDEEPIRNLLERILSADGFDCRMAVDAAEGRRLMQQQPADLVLSDINMPGESGLDFIKFVKTAYPDTGVVIVSVISEPEVARTVLTSLSSIFFEMGRLEAAEKHLEPLVAGLQLDTNLDWR